MKVLITGPESTGKTTISKFISNLLDAIYIPEFARIYLENNGPSYIEEDLRFFAKEHVKVYEKQSEEKTQIFDTSLIDIVVWSLYKYGRCDPWIIEQAKDLHFDLICLTTPDVLWTADALRENENNRDKLYALFENQLDLFGLHYEVLHANANKREKQLIMLINNRKNSQLE